MTPATFPAETYHPCPVELRQPLSVVLARRASQISAVDGMPGESRYEPKWDGFRLLIVDDDVSLLVTARTNLTRSFPKLAAAAEFSSPTAHRRRGAVVWSDDRLDFESEAQRRTLHPCSHRQRPTRVLESPSTSSPIIADPDR